MKTTIFVCHTAKRRAWNFWALHERLIWYQEKCSRGKGSAKIKTSEIRNCFLAHQSNQKKKIKAYHIAVCNSVREEGSDPY